MDRVLTRRHDSGHGQCRQPQRSTSRAPPLDHSREQTLTLSMGEKHDRCLTGSDRFDRSMGFQTSQQKPTAFSDLTGVTGIAARDRIATGVELGAE